MGSFPLHLNANLKSRRKDGRRKGREKIHSHRSFIAQDKPFQLALKLKQRVPKKALGHLSGGEKDYLYWNTPLMHSAWERLDEHVQVSITTDTTDTSTMTERQVQSLTCVLRAHGLCYLSPVHAVLLIHNSPTPGATPEVNQGHKQRKMMRNNRKGCNGGVKSSTGEWKPQTGNIFGNRD